MANPHASRFLPVIWALITAPPLLTALLVSSMAPFREPNLMIFNMAAHAVMVEFVVILTALMMVGTAAIRTIVPPVIWVLIGTWLVFHIWSTAQYGAFDGAAFGAAVDVVQLCYALALAALVASLDGMQRRRLGKLLAIGWLLFILGAFAFAAMIPDDPDYPWISFGYATRNIRPLAYLIAIGGMFAFAETHDDEVKTWRWVGLITAALTFAFVAGSGSRAAFLGMVVSILLALPFLEAKRRARFWKSAAASLAFAVPIALAWAPKVPGFGLTRVLGFKDAAGISSGGSPRLDLWQATIDKLWDMPIQGYGRHHFIGIVESSHWYPHNVLLQYWFDWGWIGGSAALLLLVGILFASLRGLVLRPARCVGPYAAIACALFVSLLDGPLFDTLPIFVFATFTGMLLAAFKPQRR